MPFPFDRPVRMFSKRTISLGWKGRSIGQDGCAHQWPADIVTPEQLLYGFDLRKDKRQLFALLRIRKGGSFSFRSMQDFAQTVAGLIEHTPTPEDDDYSRKKWEEIQDRLARNRGKSCIGICYTLKVEKAVAITLKGEFPRLGWCNLTDPNYGMTIGERQEEEADSI